jgi:phosphoglycerate kinase
VLVRKTSIGLVIESAKTVVWNGPMGAFENPAFAQGSFTVGHIVAGVRGLSIVGGGDTDVVVHQAGLADKMAFISTGGGASLEFLEGKELPAFAALKECQS